MRSRLFSAAPESTLWAAISAADRAASFGHKLARRTGLDLRLIDEALTSREAERQLRESGVDPRRHPERVDALAARMLLQEALDSGA